MIVTFDTETTTKNKGNPFTASNKLVAYAVKRGDSETTFHYFNDIDFLAPLRNAMQESKLVVGFNVKFDLHWARRYGIVPPVGARIWDCQIAEFILRGQQGAYPSLNEACERFGIGRKDDKIAEYWNLGLDTPDIPVDELRVYNILDVDLTYKLYLEQFKAMTEKQRRLCFVQGLDLLVLADMEWNGVKFNNDLCRKKAAETTASLQKIAAQLRDFAPLDYFNWDSGYHLSCLLYGGAFEVRVPEKEEIRVYQSGLRKGQEYTKTHWKVETARFERLFTPLKRTETKLVSKADGAEHTIYTTSADVLKQLRAPSKSHRLLIKLLLERAELAKLLDTYYGAMPELMEKMEWGDLLHGQYNQTVAATGRLSSSNPNMQNFSGDVDELLVSRYAS